MAARAAMDPRARGWEIRQVPLTVAPPPRTGEAAQGPWFADPPSISATDHAPMPSDDPATQPAHPQSAAAARTAAAGAVLKGAATAPPPPPPVPPAGWAPAHQTATIREPHARATPAAPAGDWRATAPLPAAPARDWRATAPLTAAPA